MNRKLLTALAGVLIAVAAFGAGYRIGGDRGMHLPIYSADCQTGVHMGTCRIGDGSYGIDESVFWTDSSGSFHDRGWPDCLPDVQEVKGVRVAATVVWVGDFGVSQVLWVDCQTH